MSTGCPKNVLDAQYRVKPFKTHKYFEEKIKL